MSAFIITDPVERAFYKRATIAVTQTLNKYNVYPPEDLFEILSSSPTPNADLQAFRHSISYEELRDSPKFKEACVELLILGTAAVHDQWCIESISAFHDHWHSDQQYRFMPFYMLDFETAMMYSLYVEPVLAAIALEPDRSLIMSHYLDDQRIYFSSRGITTASQLASYLMAENTIMPHQSISQVLHHSKSTAERIAHQIATRSPYYFRP